MTSSCFQEVNSIETPVSMRKVAAEISHGLMFHTKCSGFDVSGS